MFHEDSTTSSSSYGLLLGPGTIFCGPSSVSSVGRVYAFRLSRRPDAISASSTYPFSRPGSRLDDYHTCTNDKVFSAQGRRPGVYLLFCPVSHCESGGKWCCATWILTRSIST